MKDYRNTLNIPFTDFDMKANLNQKEPKMQENWILEKLDKKILARNKANKKTYTLHDGPPYANGNIHIGHALNLILKDFIIRYKSMQGYYSKFIPGWDTHGLPIELELQKKGINTPQTPIIDKRKNCKKFALDNVYIQQDQIRRLGILSDMDEIYLTCDLDYEINQLKMFVKMISSNLVYQDLKPVYWSWSSQTALADAEIIYDETEVDSIYFSCVLAETNDFATKNDNLLIWTTTPWTLPSNLAIAVNPKIDYSRIKVDNKFYIVATNLIEKIAAKLEWKNYFIVSNCLGKKFENLKYQHPFYAKKNEIICAEYVSDSDGTGLVHNAPGFGHDDYLACKKYNIKVFCPIDAYGKFTSEVKDKELENKFYLDTNPIIIERLKKNNLLNKHERITHSEAHDWRTKKPVIYRATRQWFVNISKIKTNILKELTKVKSVDKQIIVKMKEMINNRQEWCISRQRYWGVPIPILYDKDDQPILDVKLINNIIAILEEEGINAWYSQDAKYFLTPNYPSAKKYKKETDIMDVWFDSGVSFQILIANKLSYPADLYFEGKDQFRGWFNSSLITSVAVNKKAPYKALLTHGFVLDEKGNKMSKSLGNVIDPLSICNELGADVLRLWVASSDYVEDVRISKEIIDQNVDFYRKIRNSLFRYVLSNLNDYDFKYAKKAKYNDADLYVLYNVGESLKEIDLAYNSFNFKNVYRVVLNMLNNLLSWYFDYIKSDLYCEAKLSERRITIQTVLYIIIDNFVRVLAPILPHTCEEAYDFLNKKNKEKSIHLEKWSIYKFPSNLKVNVKKWEEFFKLRRIILSELEREKNEQKISCNNEAIVIVTQKDKSPFAETKMADFLGIAKIEFVQKQIEDVQIKIKNSKYSRCERCRNYFEEKSFSKKDMLCLKCIKTLKTI